MDQEYLEDKVVTLKKLTGYQRLRDAFGLIMLVVAVYLTIALVSFDRADPSWSQTAWHEPIHNSAGHFGAWCADVLFSIFGGVAYTLPILFFVYCWNAFSRRSPHDLFDYFTFSIRVIGFLALILSSCALADINFDDWHNFSSGGVLGSLISGGVIPKFNHAGATLILLFMWAIGLTLFTGWSWLTITEKIGGIVISVVSFTLNQLRKKNEASAQAKADYEPMDSVNLNTTNERAANLALGAENVNNLSWSGIDEPDVHENQLTLNWDTQNGVEAIDDEKKTSILFSPQYPPINTEPTIASLVPQSSEPFGPNENILATQTESDRISQIVSAITNSQPSGDTPLATKASSADLSNSPLSDRYSQFERDEFIQAEPDRISQIVSAMTSLQPSDGTPLATKASSADLSNSPLPNRPSQLEQGEFTQATAKLDSPIVNKPIFTPAKTKVIPELPRPNPVRIPTRRELMSYGIRIASRKNIEGVDRQEGSLAAERDSLVDGYNDRLDKASLRDEYSKQQKARYGEEYELDVSIASSNERIQEYKSANSPADDWIEAGIAVSHNRYETLTEPTLTPTPTISAEAEAKKQVLLYEYKDSYTPIPSNSVKSPTQDDYPYNNENVNASTIGAEHVQREADEPLVSETTLTNSDYRTTSFEQTQAYSNPVASRAPISSEPEQCDDSDINEQDDVTALREEPNIGESIIHPFLMRNERPLQKPTTPLPMLDLLTPPPSSVEPIDVEQLEQIARLIEDRLADYRVKASVVDILPGPVITLYELDLAPGVKAARISNLSRDLARSLSTVAVRVVEVIPGRPYVGLELPNKLRQTVYLREVLDCTKFRDIASPLAIVLGKDISGQPVVADLAKMPHVLVAGTTGSGKSVGVNAMIISMLYKATPDDVRFIMIDPKMLELSVYEGIPHLLTEVVTDMKDASNALRWCVGEMERRYKLMSALGVRNLAGYNERIQQAIDMGRPVPDPFWKPSDSMDLSCPTLEKLPYIVVIVDEFADLMMAVGKKVEELIARLAQKARAAGIHLVLATQRPSVDVITGLIKANIPTRIAFTVSSKIDSRTILDQGGAESLLGMGDMLYMAPNSSIPVRVHGAFVRDEEVHAVVQDWKARGKPQYIENITSASEEGDSGLSLDAGEELDPLFDQAVAFVIEKRKPSISGVQRQFRIGYNRAARIVEQMEAQGIVSPPGHNGNREVLAPPPHD